MLMISSQAELLNVLTHEDSMLTFALCLMQGKTMLMEGVLNHLCCIMLYLWHSAFKKSCASVCVYLWTFGPV